MPVLKEENDASDVVMRVGKDDLEFEKEANDASFLVSTVEKDVLEP